MTLGQKLKEIRKRFGLSQEGLAEIMNVSRQAVTKWENDMGLPDTSNLLELSKVFGLTIDYFFNNDTELPLLVMRKELNKEDYKSKLSSYNQILNKYFPSPWEVYSLIKTEKENKLETALDILTGGLIYWTIKELIDLSVYCLAIKDNLKLLINIKDFVLTVKELPNDIKINKFTVDNKIFKKGPLIKLDTVK